MIKALKIGYLKEIKLLAEDVKQIFSEFVSDFKRDVLSINALKEVILKDVFNFKGSASIIESIFKRIEGVVNNSMVKIETAVNKRMEVIKIDK